MMDILVHPTYREGLPNALLEASASELPVVSTDIPGCNEVVENGVSGILVTPRSTEELRDAVEVLVVDGAMRKTMGKVGRARVLQRYEQSLIWKHWKELYDASLATVR
jgi:glycosyltransferase involved in cell wall biosynthesis